MSKLFKVSNETTTITSYVVDIDLNDRKIVKDYCFSYCGKLYITLVNDNELVYDKEDAFLYKGEGGDFVDCVEMDTTEAKDVERTDVINLKEEEEEKEYNNGDYYCNYYHDKDRSIIMVAGGGIGKGNGYANVENRDGKFFYCEYGANPVEKYIGNKIIYDDPNYDYNFRVVA